MAEVATASFAAVNVAILSFVSFCEIVGISLTGLGMVIIYTCLANM